MGRLALRWKAQGPFGLRRSAKTSRALDSRTLAVGLTQAGTFLMEATEGFDVVLVPVK
jgi:hypothetical protein